MMDYIRLPNLKKEPLIKLYEFENELGFVINSNINWVNFINFFIVRRHFNIALLLLKIMRELKRSNFIKKVFRKINGIYSN